ncbi:MAG: hypothetical protein MRZ79_01715 [Bacteroidia bacterium]|nr:hypothetical protein [Bacteroidia bacterium]
MKTLIKASLLFVFAIFLSLPTLVADEAEGINTARLSTETFYFPEFDSSMEQFWGDMGILNHTCSATSWLGHYASASCAETQMCECSSNFMFAACSCNSPGN